MRLLGRRPLQELQPGRRREEQVADLDAGPERVGRRLDRAPDAAVHGERPRLAGADGSADQGQPADRADRRQRLAAEAEGREAGEIVARSSRWRAARAASEQVVAAIPRRRRARRSADWPPSLEATSMRAGAGVDRVLDQLLHRRRRPLDHFAGGDAVDDAFRQPADRHQSAFIALKALIRPFVEELRRSPVRRLQLGQNGVRQLFAELDAPLVEAVDVPDDALDEDLVLVERNEQAEREGSSFLTRIELVGRLPRRPCAAPTPRGRGSAPAPPARRAPRPPSCRSSGPRSARRSSRAGSGDARRSGCGLSPAR